MLDEWKKIGAALTGLGILFMALGVLLFFDKGLLAMGNLMFLSGIILILGVRSTYSFMFQKKKLRGTLCFLGGIALVLLRYPVFGILVEVFGFVNLFGNFFPIVVETLRRLPVVGAFFNLAPVIAVTDAVVNRVRPNSFRPV